METQTFDFIGKRIPRTDSKLQVTGLCAYGEEYSEPNMLIAKGCFSKYPHAKIKRIDTAAAERMPGVRGVITWKDVPVNRNGCGFYGISDQPILAQDVVRYRGDCIAVVAAETREQAEQAAAAVEVEYEPLDAVYSVEEALAPDAPLLHPDLFASNVPYHLKAYIGNVEDGFAASDYIIEGTYRTEKLEHAYIEPHMALAKLEPDGRLVITTTTSRVFNYIGVLRTVLNIPMSRLQIKGTAGIGGGFGGKNEVIIEPWVALLALKTKRPVRMILTREEDMRITTARHPYEFHYKTGVTKDGRLLAQEVRIYANTGAYLALGKSQLQKATVHAAGPYNVPNIRSDGYLVLTNTKISSAMRGMGMPQACFACESHMDEIARAIGMDPLELRRKNLFSDHGRLPNGQLVWSEPLGAALDRALALQKKTAPLPELKAPYLRRGHGMSLMIYPQDPSNPSSCTGVFVKVDSDGTAVLYNGHSDVGQGSATILVQIAADTLGIPVDQIRFLTAYTVTTPSDEGTGASRTTYIVGRCVKDACEKCKIQLFQAAARKLGFADYRKFVIQNGEIVLDTYPDIHISVADAAYESERVQGFPIMAAESYSTLSSVEDPENGHCRHYEKHAYAAQLADVEVNTRTGEVTVQRLIAVHSCGRAINPMMVEGQIQGGVQMGLGQALTEQLFESRSDGRILNDNLRRYQIPTAVDMPKQFIADYVEVLDKDGPYGALGVGEPAPVPTPAAIRNAVCDALGFAINELPLTPEKILLEWDKHQHSL